MFCRWYKSCRSRMATCCTELLATRVHPSTLLITKRSISFNLAHDADDTRSAFNFGANLIDWLNYCIGTVETNETSIHLTSFVGGFRPRIKQIKIRNYSSKQEKWQKSTNWSGRSTTTHTHCAQSLVTHLGIWRKLYDCAQFYDPSTAIQYVLTRALLTYFTYL